MEADTGALAFEKKEEALIAKWNSKETGGRAEIGLPEGGFGGYI